MSGFSPDDLRAALASHPWAHHPALPGRTNHLRAGVLVPLIWSPQPEAILIERAAHLRRHAGEVGFPGGRPESEDADLLATALREAREELGIEEPRVLGRLASMPVYTSDFRLEPFVAECRQGRLVPDPGEVGRVIRTPIAHWLGRSTLDCVMYQHEGEDHPSPVFELDGATLYGASAHTFFELLGVCARAAGLVLPPFKPSGHSWSALMSTAASRGGRP